MSQRGFLWWIVGLCALACSAGIAYAVWFGTAADGGRGGAVGVAIAFFALFSAHPNAEETLDDGPFDAVTGEEPSLDPKVHADLIQRLHRALADILDAQATERWFLTMASVVSTLVWGFGDWIALSLGAAP